MADNKFKELTDLKQALAQAKETLQKQDDYIKQLNEAAHGIGTVIDLRGDRMTVSGRDLMDVQMLEGVRVGDRVTLHPESQQPIGVIPFTVPTGIVGVVREARENQAEIEIDGSVRAVRTDLKLQPGERVVVDGTLTTTLGSLGMPKEQFDFETGLNVSWDDVGGCEDAKAQLQEAIELPYRHKALFAKYGKRPVKGVLLYGPPGNGKTMLAKAAATALARVHGNERAEGFRYVKGPALLSKWVGETEAQIRALFTNARKHMAKHGYPALVFIDEADALLGSRDQDRLGVNSISVPQFLAEMDGLEETGALFVLATNRPDSLDAAVVREGRVDRKVRVGRPDRKAAEQILGIHLRGRPTASQSLPCWTADRVFTGNDVVRKHGDRTVTLKDAVSGAMLAGIVEQASTRALLRDAVDNTETGIDQNDMEWAVQSAAEQIRDTDHREILRSMGR